MIDRRVSDRPVPVERRRGRPREFDGMLSVRVSSAVHDDLIQEALRRDVDVSDVIRERISQPSHSVSQKTQA